MSNSTKDLANFIHRGKQAQTAVDKIIMSSEEVIFKNKNRRIDNARLQGIACALGELAEAHMERDLAMMVLSSLGLSIDDLEAAGADSFDLNRLKNKA